MIDELKERIVLAESELRLAKSKRCQAPSCIECRAQIQYCQMAVNDAVANLAAYRKSM